jgi:stress-induced morphogen
LTVAITIRGEASETLLAFKEALSEFEKQHPHARIDLYQRNGLTVRVRVIDPCFAGLRRSERHDLVWEHLEKVPDDVVGRITMLVAVTQKELKDSYGNMEFEKMSPSLIP